MKVKPFAHVSVCFITWITSLNDLNFCLIGKPPSSVSCLFKYKFGVQPPTRSPSILLATQNLEWLLEWEIWRAVSSVTSTVFYEFHYFIFNSFIFIIHTTASAQLFESTCILFVYSPGFTAKINTDSPKSGKPYFLSVLKWVQLT
jgi:hypothetical protein